MKLILVNGKKRSGKDFFAKALKEELRVQGKTSEIMSFADPIKDIIATTFNISQEDLDVYKNYPQDYGYVIQSYPSNQPITDIQDGDFRSILQNFGTEAMKKYFGEDVWVDLLINSANNLDVDYIIVPDFRFLCENIGCGITIKIRNDEIDKNSTDNHRSENELNDFVFDYVLDNSNYDDITPKIKQLIIDIGL